MTIETEKKLETPEQRRAKHAWDETKHMEGEGENAKDFANQCKQTTARILNSGLMPALAFMDAKIKNADADKGGPSSQMQKCRDALVSWLRQFVGGTSEMNVKSLLGKLMDADGAMLRRAQAEALAYLEWLARFAEGKA